MTAEARRLFDAPPAAFDKEARYLEQLSPTQRADIARELEHIAEHCARAASYLAYRQTFGPSHHRAAKKSNIVVRQLRRAFGYQRTPDLSF